MICHRADCRQHFRFRSDLLGAQFPVHGDDSLAQVSLTHEVVELVNILRFDKQQHERITVLQPETRSPTIAVSLVMCELVQMHLSTF